MNEEQLLFSLPWNGERVIMNDSSLSSVGLKRWRGGVRSLATGSPIEVPSVVVRSCTYADDSATPVLFLQSFRTSSSQFQIN